MIALVKNHVYILSKQVKYYINQIFACINLYFLILIVLVGSIKLIVILDVRRAILPWTQWSYSRK